MNLVLLFGAPCSGKSTVGQQIADRLGYKYISSGDIAREIAAMDQVALQKLNSGAMAPEDAMRDQIFKRLHSAFDKYYSIVLDGFPRFQSQYDWLVDKIASTWGMCSVNMIKILLDVSPTTLIARAMIRERSDDAAIGKRMMYYYKNTEPMIKELTDVYIIDANNLPQADTVNFAIDLIHNNTTINILNGGTQC